MTYPTYEYDDETEFLDAYDYAAFHATDGTPRPNLLDHPDAEDMLRAGFDPINRGGQHLWGNLTSRPSQSIMLVHFPDRSYAENGTHMCWSHDVYGEGERIWKFYPRLLDALGAARNRGPYTTYWRSPDPGGQLSNWLTDDTQIQVEDDQP